MKTKLNKTTKVVLLVCLILTVLAGSAFAAQKMFSDSIGHWAEEIINTLSQEGVVNGYPDGTVQPDATITRAEFCALVERTTSKQADKDSTLDVKFTDIASHWAEKDITLTMERRVKRKFHARCGAGENLEITSKDYLSSLYNKSNITYSVEYYFE